MVCLLLPGVARGQDVDGTPILNEDQKLLAPDGAFFDWFGASVAVTGDTLMVGALKDDDLGEDSGSVYVYERDEAGTWAIATKLQASDAAAFKEFGFSMAVRGDTLVVGAPGDESGGDFPGSAYVFQRDAGGPGSWDEEAILLASDGAAGDEFGISVAISGDTVVVGATEDEDLGDHSGSAYVFERDKAGTWTEVAKLLAPDGEGLGFFGRSVAISGDTLVVGASDADGLDFHTGSAYVFERDGAGTWVEVAKLVASDGENNDHFGSSTAVGDDRVFVGANSAESVYVFERDGAGAWMEVAILQASDEATFADFGGAMALAGDTLVVGAETSGDPGFAFGTAYIFKRDEGGAWVELARLRASDPGILDAFSGAVAIDADTVVAGARSDDDPFGAAGSAYVFSLGGCVLNLRLDSSKVGAGDELSVELYLQHNRIQTVAVPFVIWIEDEAGSVVASQTTPAITFHHGDTIQKTLMMRIPEGTPPGRYALLVGIQRMQQGVAGATVPFLVEE